MRRAACLLVSLACLAGPRPSAQSLDERAIRDLAGRFFAAYAEQDAGAIAAMVSRRSPHHAALVAERPAAGVSDAIVATPTIGRIRVEATRATADVLIEIAIGSESTSVVSAERLLLCERSRDAWQVWNLVPSLGELVDRVIAAPTSGERLDVLGEDREWLGAEIGPALVARGDRQFQLGRYNDARRAYDAAVAVGGAIDDAPSVTAGLRGVGNVHLYAGELDAAMDAYRSSLARARDAADPRDVIRALNGIGNVHAARQHVEDALASYEEAMGLAESVGDESSMAAALNNIANTEVSRRRYDEALDRYRRALAIKERLGDNAAVSIGAYNIARVLFLQRKYAESLNYHHRSLALAESLGRTAGMVSVHRGLAETYARLQDDARAMYHYQASLEAAFRIGDRGTAVEDLIDTGRLWLKRGDAERALPPLQRAADIAGSLKRPALEARALDQLGLAWQARASYAAARAAHENARRLRGGRPDAAAVDGLMRVASISLHEHDDRAALENLEAAREAAERIGDGPRAVAALSRIAAVRQERQEHALALEAVAAGRDRAHLMDDDAGSAALESTAGHALARLQRFDEALAAFDRAIAASESDRRSAADELPADIAAAEPLFGPYAAAAELQLSRGRAAEAWRYLERGRTATLRNVLDRPGDPEAAASSVRSAGSARDVGVGYFVTDRQVHIFVFSPRAGNEARLLRSTSVAVERSVLVAAIEGVRGALDGRAATADARALYDLLIKPVEASLPKARGIRIIPDGVLWRLPFEALQRKSGRFLIEDHAVSYALFAGPRAIGETPDQGAAGRGDLLSVGVDGPAAEAYPWLRPLYSPGDMPAIDGRLDAERAGSIVPASRGMTLVGAAATEAAFAAAAPAYRLLHIAALVRLDDRDPLHSGVLLAPTGAEDGLLDAGQIADLRLSANALVLPSTWTTSEDSGEDAGLALRVQASAWRQAGCPQIIVSRSGRSDAERAEAIQELERVLVQAASPREAYAAAAAVLQRIARRAIARAPAGSGPRWTGLMLLSVD